MINGMMTIWFILLALSVLFSIVDLPRQPIMGTQKLGWFLVILYTGVVGLVLYLLSCRSPGKGLHDIYIKPLWKQAVNSEVHCVAGDATGIILAAIVLSFFTLSLSFEVTLEYIAAFLFGWFIFQAGMMRNMFPSYKEALTKTFFSEAVSMNTVMVGMIPTMVILIHYLPGSMDPLTASFWFRMGIATMAGWVLGYPANYLLVKYNLKHGCMTKNEENQVHNKQQHAEQHQSHAEQQHSHTEHDQSHAEHQHSHTGHDQSHAEHHQSHAEHQHSHAGHDQSHTEHQHSHEHHMHMNSISITKQIFYIVVSFVIMILASYLAI